MSTWNWSLNGLPLQVGPSGKAADGVSGQLRGLYDRTVGVADTHGRYQEATIRGAVNACVNSAAQALSLTGTTTYTGMVVYNTPNSGKNLVLLEAIYAPTSTIVTSGGAIILFSQAVAATLPTLTTTNVSTSPFSTFMGGGVASAAKVASSCTLAANPIFLRPLASMQFSGTPATVQLAQVKDEIGGSIVIPPGAGVGIVAVTTAITGIAYLSWEEVPV
jgi:hypothetical protein